MKKLFIIAKLPSQETFSEANQILLEWESRLRSLGFEVWNPLKEISIYTDLFTARKQRIKGILECTGIFLLDNWKECNWSRHEFYLASILRYDIYHENENSTLQTTEGSAASITEIFGEYLGSILEAEEHPNDVGDLASRILNQVIPLIDVPEESSNNN